MLTQGENANSTEKLSAEVWTGDLLAVKWQCYPLSHCATPIHVPWYLHGTPRDFKEYVEAMEMPWHFFGTTTVFAHCFNMSSPALQSCSQAAGVEPNTISCLCFMEWESTPIDSVCDSANRKIQTDLLINSLNRADLQYWFIHDSGFAIVVILRSWQNIY